MDDLLNAVSKLVAKAHPDQITYLAEKVRKLSGVEVASSLNDWATASASNPLKRLIKVWASNPIESSELAGMLVGGGYCYQVAKQEEVTELVWTGPSTPFVPVRNTQQVMLNVIKQAKSSLFLVSFVTYKIDAVDSAILAAIERGVNVSILVEPGEEQGGKLDKDLITPLKKRLPGVKVYIWSPNTHDQGLVHAKCVVSDYGLVFVTSANLTQHAMEKNMELGLLVKGGDVPKMIQKHLEALVTTKVLLTV